tara:strand:+ start:81 stop:1085 length:1005 start_codon:yes stop_codon:yes gene_type:complete
MILFPEIAPFETGHLTVTDGHCLYWERIGRRGGVPALFLHGGPGSGCTPTHRRYFDPDVFDLILLDQRGAGRSTPTASLKGNTTADLIADLERIRERVGFDRWVVAGPSWGSTLALAYAEAHPDHVSGLLVEGVFLGTQSEIDWWHSPHGVARVFPDAYADFVAPLPTKQRDTAASVLAWYQAAMDEEWTSAAPELAGLHDPATPLERLRKSALYRWTEFEERISWLDCDADQARSSLAQRGADYVAAHSRIEAHFFANRCFLEEGQLLHHADRLAETPIQIVQSRYDMVCPPRAAYQLSAACPHTELTLIPVNGHAMTEAVHPAFIRALAKLV